MKPKISVIVPAYNVAPWIGRCLDSILAQSYDDLEIIVIDDGSTDDTGKIIDQYAARDGRILAIHQPNGGLVAAREVGIAKAAGEYVTFVDADDDIVPDMYERLMENALKYDADISHCGVTFVYPDGREEPHYGTGVKTRQNNVQGLRELLAGEKVEPTLCTKLFKKELLTDSCMDAAVLNNEDLLRNFVCFSRAKQSIFEDFCGYRYYQRPGSMSKDPTKAEQSLRHILRARRLILDNCNDEIYPHAMRLWLSTYVNAYQQHGGQIAAECRRVLREERKNIRYLIPRQRVAANLIVYAPWLHRLIYKIYTSRR